MQAYQDKWGEDKDFEQIRLDRTISFTDLYLRTLLTEFIAIALRLWWLTVVALVIIVPLVVVSSIQYGLGTLLDLDYWRVMLTWLLVWFFLLLWPARRIFLSLLVFLTGGFSDVVTARQLGARELTREERRKLTKSLEQIPKTVRGQPVSASDRWRILDSPIPNSYTIGQTSYLTSAAIDSDYLGGFIAHELGHIQNGDGRRMKALRQLVHPFAFFLGLDRQVTPIGATVGGSLAPVDSRGSDEKLVRRVQAWQIQLEATAKLGGYGLLIYCMQWADYWRQQDFLADNFVVDLGMHEGLIQILKQYKVFDIAQPFLLSGRPYSAERIDRLER